MSGTDVLDRVVTTKEAAHEAVSLAYEHAKALILNGDRVRITCAEDQDDISIKQRKFLHGPVFGQISEQVRVAGERYTTDVWKEFFRKLLLESKPKYVMQRIPRWDPTLCRLVQPKRATPHRVRRSTEDMGIRDYSTYIDQVIAHAATEFGVEFRFLLDEREAVRYVRKSRKAVPA